MTLTARLREQVYAAMGDRTYATLAEEIGISRVALWQFLRGKPSKSTTLDAVDRWLAHNVSRGKH